MNAPLELTERPVQLRGSRVALALLRLAGWQLDFDGLPARQGVLVVYPHTSNWDFPVGMLAKWAMGFPAMFWGKDSLFRIPLFGRWLSWIGGVPVDRGAPGGIVPDMVQRLRTARERDDFYWLVLAPEGTRSWRPAWRSGFYRVTVGAGVPLGLAHIDYGRRRVGVHSCLRLCGEVEADMAEIARRLGPARGYRPQLASPIVLGATEPAREAGPAESPAAQRTPS
jgi:1-acyl-sn-glycerol-3-phosphate acyltransferase